MQIPGADCVVAVHAAYVAFVVTTPVLVVVGAWAGWSWVRNAWLRYLHLAAIGIVVGESLIGMDCPLTALEDSLRSKAEQPTSPTGFIGRFLHNLVFVDFDPGHLSICYAIFGLLVVGLLFAVPPNRRRLR